MSHGSLDTTKIDQRIGQRLKKYRILRNMSQTTLGIEIGVSYQQIFKYENGQDRISASRLFLISRALDIPITFFYEGLPTKLSGAA